MLIFSLGQICKAWTFSDSSVVNDLSRPLDAGLSMSKLIWAIWVGALLLSRDRRSSRARKVHVMTRRHRRNLGISVQLSESIGMLSPLMSPEKTSSTWIFRKPRVLIDVTLGHVKTCSALRVALGARVGHEHRIPSLSTDVVIPSDPGTHHCHMALCVSALWTSHRCRLGR